MSIQVSFVNFNPIKKRVNSFVNKLRNKHRTQDGKDFEKKIEKETWKSEKIGCFNEKHVFQLFKKWYLDKESRRGVR